MVTGPAAAQPRGLDLATYEGPDRLDRLVEGARKEGELNLLTSAPADDMKALADAFEKKYGAKVKIWRASAERVLSRARSEAKAKQYEADVLETGGIELDAMRRDQLLATVRSPAAEDIVAAMRLPHAEWARTRLSVYAIAWNTRAVSKDEVPRSYEALLDARWKGKLGIEADDGDWFAALARQQGERRTERLFRDVVARNGVTVRKGHASLASQVAEGDIALALTVYSQQAEALKRKGAPIDWTIVPPAIARTGGVAVSAHAPHPHAALLWYEFELSEEGQKLLEERGFVPTSRRVDSALRPAAPQFIDGKATPDDAAGWDKRYAEIFGGKGSGK
jgi:iron(III) transport system substrate-binding protein